ncbi:DUF4249 family protein [Sediminitomix flava]|uniref:Uncharacterized protein DUF4249 n=1 Tax=Sediminitomix flava TaxID=379075 RepID=A0A315Z4N8_SEDFL|nr:DUF4249 family protein [Sediminitomix flava]PWJ38443.1 uncharacterized protein DUF4249 [Sediminitomix flava]
MKTIHILLLFSILIISCDELYLYKDVEEKHLPEFQQDIVVYGYLKPQTDILRVYVAKTDNPYELSDESSRTIEDADVFISDENGQTVQLLFNETYALYEAIPNLFSIEEGKTYYLDINYKNKIVSAQCTVPFSNTSLIIEKFKTDIESDHMFYKYNGESNYKFTPSDGHYYYSFQITYLRTKVDTVTFEHSHSPVYGLFGEDINTKDEANPFKTRVASFTTNLNQHQDSLLEQYICTLYTLDESFYLNQEDRRNLLEFEDNPFIEPKNSHSNIDGGIGIFTAYSQYDIVIE